MKALIQRVKSASVRINGEVFSSIQKGYVVLLGIKDDDDFMDAEYLANRCVDLRVFEDENNKMNRSLEDVNGEMLIISQFTLHADTRKGNRPSFIRAASAELAETLYEHFIKIVKSRVGKDKVKTGKFREMMDIELTNSGPVTILLQSKSEYEKD